MTHLNTTNPFALRYLMDDAIYNFQMVDNSLDTPVTTNSAVLEEPATSYTFLGENKKRILYLIEDQQNEYFSKEALEAFSKTIQALSLFMADVAVMNVSRQAMEVTFEKLLHFFNPQKLIFAGPSPGQFGLTQLSLNQATEAKNIRVLHTYTFEEMLQDVNKKKTFWTQIKSL